MRDFDDRSRRGLRTSANTCRHGYEWSTSCPRCGVTPSTPVRSPIEQTRWHPTVTTMGPVGKITLSTVLLLPVVVCLLGLLEIGDHFANLFLVLPLAMFSIVAAVGIKFTWELDRPTHRAGGQRRRAGAS
jgi:hypothetical protein